MDILTLGILGFIGYQLVKKDDRPAKLRAAAQAMLLTAQQLESSGQIAPAQSLRAQAQALIAQAASLSGADDDEGLDGLDEFGRSWRKKLKRHLSPVEHLKAARRVADQLVGEKKIPPSRHAEATQAAVNEISSLPVEAARAWGPRVNPWL